MILASYCDILPHLKVEAPRSSPYGWWVVLASWASLLLKPPQADAEYPSALKIPFRLITFAAFKSALSS